MRFFAIEPPSMDQGYYPTFLGVEGKQIVVGKSDRHDTIEFGEKTIIRSNKGNTTESFTNGKADNGLTIREIDTAKPAQKHLLWYVWIGGGNPSMLIKSITSYITVGGFTGDIAVLSDRDTKFPELDKFPQVKFYKVNAKARFGKMLLTRINIFCIKPLIGEYVDLSRYDWMIYSDADILAVQPHLTELFRSMDDKGFVYYSKDNGCLDHRSTPCGLGVVTEEEIRLHGKFSCNAGWIYLPCNDLGLEVLRKWSAMERAGEYEVDDQACLYALLIRETWPRKLALGVRAAWDGYGMSPQQSESQIIHFYGNERYLQDVMAKTLGI